MDVHSFDQVKTNTDCSAVSRLCCYQGNSCVGLIVKFIDADIVEYGKIFGGVYVPTDRVIRLNLLKYWKSLSSKRSSCAVWVIVLTSSLSSLQLKWADNCVTQTSLNQVLMLKLCDSIDWHLGATVCILLTTPHHWLPLFSHYILKIQDRTAGLCIIRDGKVLKLTVSLRMDEARQAWKKLKTFTDSNVYKVGAANG